MIVAYNPTLFHARYAEFAAVSDVVLGAMFTEAGLYCNNTDASPVSDVNERTMLLNMLTAHIAMLAGLISPDGKSMPVGRMNAAGQGSVSVGFEYQVPGTAAWFAQTQYGAAFWQATNSYRGMSYRPYARAIV